MSAAIAAIYLIEQGPHRWELAIELARGIVADDRSPADEVARASVVLEQAGLAQEASVAAVLAVSRGAAVAPLSSAGRRAARARQRGRFSHAA